MDKNLVNVAENLDDVTDAPTKWRYDEENQKLIMLYRDGEVTHIVKSRAIIGENNGFFRLATLENSRRVCLWNSNKCASLVI